MSSTNPNWDRQRVWSQIEAKLDKKKKRRLFWWFFMGGMGIVSLVSGFWFMTLDSYQKALGSEATSIIASKTSSDQKGKLATINLPESLDTQSRDRLYNKDQTANLESKSSENENADIQVLSATFKSGPAQGSQYVIEADQDRLPKQLITQNSSNASKLPVSYDEDGAPKAEFDLNDAEKMQDARENNEKSREAWTSEPSVIGQPNLSFLQVRSEDTSKFMSSSLDFLESTLVACCNPYKRLIEVSAYVGSFSSRFRGAESYTDLRNQTERGNFHFGLSAQLIQHIGKSFFVYGGLSGERIYSVYDHTIRSSEVTTEVGENAVYYEFPDGSIWYEAGDVEITTTTSHRVVHNNHITRAYVPVGVGFVKDYRTWSVKSKIGLDLRWAQSFSGVLFIDGIHQRDKFITNPYHDSQAFDARLHLSTQIDFNVSRRLRATIGLAYARDQFLKSRESSAAFHFVHGQMGVLVHLD